MFYPFDAYLPDVNPIAGAERGVITDCENMVPTVKGYRPASALSAVQGQQTLPAACVGLFFGRRIDETTNIYAGTSTAMYKKSGVSWGAIYTTPSGVAVDRWRFAQYGNFTIFVNKSVDSQYYDNATLSSSMTAPRANIVEVIGQQVMLGDISDAAYGGNSPDRWACSALGNPLDYVPDVGTQAASNRLLDVPGTLTAGKKIGDGMIFYKRRGMWRGRFAGPPFIWEWDLVSEKIGALTQECVINAGTFHLFLGEDDFYLFDGAAPRPIGAGVRKAFFNSFAKQYYKQVCGVFDYFNQVAYWFYPSGTSPTPNRFICYSLEAGKWGSGSYAILFAAEYELSTPTWDELWVGLTWDTIPDTAWDAAGFIGAGVIPAFIDSSGRLSLFGSTALNGMLKTGRIGNDAIGGKIVRVRPRFTDAQPSSATMTPYRAMTPAGEMSAGTTRAMTTTSEGNAFCFTQSAKWHQLQMNTVGTNVALGLDIDSPQGGCK